MKDTDLPMVVKAFKRHHPELIAHVRTLAGTEQREAANALLAGLLEIYDAGEQAKWQLRDLLEAKPKVEGGFYWAIKYNATETIWRVVAAAGMDLSGVTYFDSKQPPELTRWLEDRHV